MLYAQPRDSPIREVSLKICNTCTVHTATKFNHVAQKQISQLEPVADCPPTVSSKELVESGGLMLGDF